MSGTFLKENNSIFSSLVCCFCPQTQTGSTVNYKHVLKGDWHPAAIKLLQSRNKLILGNSKRAICARLNLTKFSTPSVCRGENQSLSLLTTVTTSNHVLPFIWHQNSACLKKYCTNAVYSFGSYDRPHSGLKQHKQWRHPNVKNAELQKTLLILKHACFPGGCNTVFSLIVLKVISKERFS